MNLEVQQKLTETLVNTTRGYGGAVDGGESGRQMKVTFPNMLNAASWAQTFKMTAHVVLDEPAITLDGSVALIFSLVTYADQLDAFKKGLGI